MTLIFHKPYGVLSQFTTDGSPHRTLAGFGLPPRVYAVGRLDADSEGLLLMTDEPGWNHRLLHPERGHEREYWVQVEGDPEDGVLERLAAGVLVQGVPTRPCRVTRLEPRPEVPPRDPPIRVRRTVPDTWLSMALVEGRNRQVRRMTAAVGCPTLRLIRVRIGNVRMEGLEAGQWRMLTPAECRALWVNPGR
jgi:23S rRNA pseudouridine2457 synthase